MVLSVVRDIVVTLAAAVGAYCAWKGLDTWRTQLRGQRQFEAALGLMKATHVLQEALESVRVDYMEGHEMVAACRACNVPEPTNTKIDIMTEPAVLKYRWSQRVAPAWADLKARRADARAILGKKTTDSAMYKLGEVTTQLEGLIGHYTALCRERSDSPDVSRLRYEIFVLGERGDDDWGGKLDEAVKVIEEFLQPKLS